MDVLMTGGGICLDGWGLAGRERVCSVINAPRGSPVNNSQIIVSGLCQGKSAAPNPSREREQLPCYQISAGPEGRRAGRVLEEKKKRCFTDLDGFKV